MRLISFNELLVCALTSRNETAFIIAVLAQYCIEGGLFCLSLSALISPAQEVFELNFISAPAHPAYQIILRPEWIAI